MTFQFTFEDGETIVWAGDYNGRPCTDRDMATMAFYAAFGEDRHIVAVEHTDAEANFPPKTMLAPGETRRKLIAGYLVEVANIPDYPGVQVFVLAGAPRRKGNHWAAEASLGLLDETGEFEEALNTGEPRTISQKNRDAIHAWADQFDKNDKETV